MMGKKHAAYSFETKLAAVRAVVDEGMTKPEAMAKFGIASPSSLKKWLRAYREEGPEALGPKPKGRPRRSGSPSKEMTREQELERRVRKLEAENAYLKKIDSPEGGEALPNREKAVVVSGLSGQYPLVDLLECAGLARSSYYYALSHPEGAHQARALGGRRRDILAHRQRVRPQADRHVPARRAGRAHSRQDGAQDDARDGHQLRDPPRDRLPQVQLLQGQGRQRPSKTSSAGTSKPTGPGRRWAPTSPSSSSPGARPTSRRSTTSAARRSSLGPRRCTPTWPSSMSCSTSSYPGSPRAASPILHSDMGWQYQQAGWCSRLEKAGVVQSMSRKGNCIDNGATEQVFGHMKDELFRGREWLCFEDFEERPRRIRRPLEHEKEQVKLKGLTPEEFRNQSLCAA